MTQNTSHAFDPPSFGFIDSKMPAIRASRWEQLVMQPLKMNFEALHLNLDR